ncbi:MAG: pilin [Candidatus Paceibacterota bacterium]
MKRLFPKKKSMDSLKQFWIIIFFATFIFSPFFSKIHSASADSETIQASCGYDTFIAGMTCNVYNDITIDMDRVEKVEIVSDAFDDYGSLQIISPTGNTKKIDSSIGCPGIGSIPAQDITSYFGETGSYRVHVTSTDNINCADDLGAWINLLITYKTEDNPIVCDTPGECQIGPGEYVVIDGQETCRYETSQDTCEADDDPCTYDFCKSNDNGVTATCNVGPYVCGGMVPCGRLADDPLTPNNDETKSCSFCHLALVANSVIDYMFKIASTLALLALIITGFLYVTSGGNPERKNAAQGYLSNIIKGYVIIFLAWLIIDFILSAWGFMDPIQGEWNVICLLSSLL